MSEWRQPASEEAQRCRNPNSRKKCPRVQKRTGSTKSEADLSQKSKWPRKGYKTHGQLRSTVPAEVKDFMPIIKFKTQRRRKDEGKRFK